jgi:hypothetical protein
MLFDKHCENPILEIPLKVEIRDQPLSFQGSKTLAVIPLN